jgi:hypothetical protein
MTIDEFIAAQHDVIAEHGLDAYLPALMIETRWRVKVYVLADPPDDTGELEKIARAWAEQLAKRQDYYLSFRVTGSHFRVVACVRGVVSERLVPAASS